MSKRSKVEGINFVRSKLAEIFKNNAGYIPDEIDLIESKKKYYVFYRDDGEWILGYYLKNICANEIVIDEIQLLELCKNYPLIKKMVIKECSNYIKYFNSLNVKVSKIGNLSK